MTACQPVPAGGTDGRKSLTGFAAPALLAMSIGIAAASGTARRQSVYQQQPAMSAAIAQIAVSHYNVSHPVD
jgi:hypothetical protein